MGLVFDELNNVCSCLDKMTGYANATETQLGFMQVNESMKSCFTLKSQEQHVDQIGKLTHNNGYSR